MGHANITAPPPIGSRTARDRRNNTLTQIIGKRLSHRMLAPNPSQHLELQSEAERNPPSDSVNP